MKPGQAYCVKDKKAINIKDPKEVKFGKHRRALRGTCPTCGTKVFRILGSK